VKPTKISAAPNARRARVEVTVLHEKATIAVGAPHQSLNESTAAAIAAVAAAG